MYGVTLKHLKRILFQLYHKDFVPLSTSTNKVCCNMSSRCVFYRVKTFYFTRYFMTHVHGYDPSSVWEWKFQLVEGSRYLSKIIEAINHT